MAGFAMKRWWQGLSPREQRIAASGAVILIACVLFVGVYEPLEQRRQLAFRQIESEAAILTSLKAMSERVAVLRSDATMRQQLPPGQSVVAFVDSAIKRHQLDDFVKRITPRQGSVSISFSAAPFDRIVAWLTALAENFGIHASGISVERIEASPGAVQATITLATG